MALPLNKWVERKVINSELHWVLSAMLMGVRSFHSPLSENQQSHVVSGERLCKLGFLIILTIRRHGWQENSFQSKSSCKFDGSFSHGLQMALRILISKCTNRSARPFSYWIISPVLMSIIFPKISRLNFLHQIWPHLCNHVMAASSVASKLTIDRPSVFVHWTSKKQENET